MDPFLTEAVASNRDRFSLLYKDIRLYYCINRVVFLGSAIRIRNTRSSLINFNLAHTILRENPK